MTDIETTENDVFAAAQAAALLRQQVSAWTREAVEYGNVDRDWANSWLGKIGAKAITGRNEYRINIPITGVYGRRVTANSRADALKEFYSHLEQALAKGKITADGSYDNVYKLALAEDAEVQFHSGPEDPPADGTTLDLEGLKAQIQTMIREGVSTRGWGHTYANHALSAMGLPELPAVTVQTVNVPVTGTTTVQVRTFEGDDPSAVTALAVAAVRGNSKVSVAVEEIGDEVAF